MTHQRTFPTMTEAMDWLSVVRLAGYTCGVAWSSSKLLWTVYWRRRRV